MLAVLWTSKLRAVLRKSGQRSECLQVSQIPFIYNKLKDN